MVKLGVNINKKNWRLISIICIFLIGIGFVIAAYNNIPNPGHGGDRVLVEINNYFMTLQEAIDGEYLTNEGNIPSTDLTTQISGDSHDARNIYISVDGIENNLNDVINGLGLCGTFSSSYSQDIIMGHSGEDVLVTIEIVEKSLQEAINVGDFCCIPISGECGDDGCGGNLGGCGSNDCVNNVCVDWTCNNPEQTCGTGTSTTVRYWAGIVRTSPPERVQFWWGGGLVGQHYCLNDPGGVCTNEHYMEISTGGYCYKRGDFITSVNGPGNYNKFYCICRRTSSC